MITIKNPIDLKHMMLMRFNPQLIDIIYYVAKYYGITVVKTFGKKKYVGDLHSDMPIREVDFEDNYKNSKEIQININKKWEYEPFSTQDIATIKNNLFHIKTSVNTRLRCYP